MTQQTTLPQGQSTHISGLPEGASFLRMWKRTQILATLMRRVPNGEVWSIHAVKNGADRGLIFHEGWRWLNESTAEVATNG